MLNPVVLSLDQIKVEELNILNDALTKIAKRYLHDLRFNKKSVLFISLALTKAYKTHQAITLLCRNELGEDAFMHSRVMFELSIICSFILQDNTRNRLEQYIDHDPVMRKKYFDNVSSGKIECEKAKLLEVDCSTANSKHDYNKWRGRWSKENIEEMAAAVGREGEYGTLYKMQCNSAHSHVVGMQDYVVMGAEKEPVVNLGPNFEMIKMALLANFDSFRLILAEYLKETNLEDKELEEAVKQFRALRGEY